MACEKRTYPSKDQAEKRASNLAIEVGYPLWAYRCPDCKKYHLTSKRPAKRSYKRRNGTRNRK